MIPFMKAGDSRQNLFSQRQVSQASFQTLYPDPSRALMNGGIGHM
jgi:hypothetical protein